MRKLMWFVIGFAGICAACAYGTTAAWVLPSFAAAVILGIAALCLFRQHQLLRPAVAVLTGCLAGLVWFGGFYLVYLRPVTVLDGAELQLSVTISDYSRETDYGAVADGILMVEEKPYQVWMYLSDGTSLHPGDTVEGLFRIRLTTPGGERESGIFQGKGIFLVLNQRGETVVPPAVTVPKWGYPAVLRQKILTMLESIFPEDVRAFTKALLLGDTWDLEHDIDMAFKISGIRHIIAVSGLHVSILYSMLCAVTMRRRFLTAAVGIPVLFLFAAMVGFTPSAVRACIMIGLMMAAMAFEREYDAPTALAFSVLVMLLANPLAVTSVSLQLSVGCVAGILLFNGPVNSWLKGIIPEKKGIAGKFRSMLCSGISVTVSSMALVTPLSAYYFGMVSLVSVLTNLLTLWVVNLIFSGLVLTSLLQLLSPAAAGFLAGILAWPIRYVVAAAKLLSSFPLAAVYTRSIYIVIWLVFVYVLLAVFLGMRKKQPGILICCGTLGLCMALLASWAEPLTADIQITMLDVGQGQSILLQSEGRSFLVDCGGDDDVKTADIVAETLLSQGISRLDGIILTHFDRDHSGGLQSLLTRVGTDCLFLPDTRNELEEPETDGAVVYVWEDLELTFGSAKLQIFGPVYSGQDNENSLCVLFDTEKCDILITGDRSAFGERMLLRRRELPDVDILVAGHHGAADSTSVELLTAVRPEMVLISVAQDNIYGHPAPALLQRLQEFGCTVYRTDLNGTITIRR